ncbi:MAG: hypothetical protein RR554_11820 [Vagococcus sp.]|uniref:hypothetical protein n=1 Tax=Vagococcus sp. TaxID=1933889 RepID=UPI002FCBE3B1
MIGKRRRIIITLVYIIAFIMIALHFRNSWLFVPFLFLGIILANSIRKLIFNKYR